MADYIEYIQSYYVPRIRYRSKFNRNTSPQGSDVLGFKLGTTPSPRDEAIIFEVKGTSDPKGKKKGYERLQEAIDHSNKDEMCIRDRHKCSLGGMVVCSHLHPFRIWVPADTQKTKRGIRKDSGPP